MILGTTRAVRVFAFPAPVDLRKGYSGLVGLVQTGLGRDPLSGELFLFVNQGRKLCKVLVWDGTGLCIFQKRLEQGTFAKLWRDDFAQGIPTNSYALSGGARRRCPSLTARIQISRGCTW